MVLFNCTSKTNNPEFYTDILVDCSCGCSEGVRIRIEQDKIDDTETYCWICYTNGNFYRDQNNVWKSIWNKARKIYAILFNKDFYYSEICMTKEDFDQFRELIYGEGV